MTGEDVGAMQGGKCAIFMKLSLPEQSHDWARGQNRDKSPVDGVLRVLVDQMESQLLCRKPGLSLLEVQALL